MEFQIENFGLSQDQNSATYYAGPYEFIEFVVQLKQDLTSKFGKENTFVGQKLTIEYVKFFTHFLKTYHEVVQ